MGLKLAIEGLHAATEQDQLNQEWITVANAGDVTFNAEGCSISVAKSVAGKPRVVTTLKAGLVIKPGEKVRLVSGSAAKKSQGPIPAEDDGVRNFYLLLKAPYLDKPGTVVKLGRGQHELCHGVVVSAGANAP